MAIKAVIFDLDDTLVVEEASAEAAFVAASKVAQEKCGIDPEDFNSTVRQKARELWHKSPGRDYCVAIGVSSWEGLWARFEGDDPNQKIMHRWAPGYQIQAWLNALAVFGVSDESIAQLLSATFQNHRRGRHIVYPDVVPVLKEFRQDYKLALITNGAPQLQRDKIKGSKLGHYFEAIVISGELGVGKPDQKIFATALKRLDISAKMAVMVGNSLKSDIAGAQQIGIKAIWLNRDGKQNDNTVKPDYEISNLNELQNALNYLEK